MKRQQQTTTTDLRQMLSDEMEKLRRGKSTTANVLALVRGSSTQIATARAEMQYARMVGKKPNLDGFIKLTAEPL